MSKKIKPQKITFKSFVRLLIFCAIIYFSINWLSSQPQKSFLSNSSLVLGQETNANFLNQIYQQLPQKSRLYIENFDFQKTTASLKNSLDGFPQKQIKEIQKKMVKDVSDKVIENIDQN